MLQQDEQHVIQPLDVCWAQQVQADCSWWLAKKGSQPGLDHPTDKYLADAVAQACELQQSRGTLLQLAQAVAPVASAGQVHAP